MRPASLFEKTTRWFDRANSALLEGLPCASGCSGCCIGLFTVTILDRQEIQRGLQALSHDHREKIEGLAADQVTTLTATAPRLQSSYFIDQWPEGEIDRLVERFEASPCPALEDDGKCGIYEYRPLVCRSMGVPSDDDVTVNGACAVQTAVPLIRLSKTLREQENQLAGIEATQLETLRLQQGTEGEELLLPVAFLSDSTMRRLKESA